MKRYLAIPGALLLITAFIRATVNIEWDTANIALAAAGGAILAMTAVWNRAEVIAWLRDPRGVFAVTPGISVAAFVALLVMLNIAVWYNPWSIDLTASGRNQVSDDTRQILARVDQPVALRQFGRASSDARIEQILRTFARENVRVSVEFSDVDRDRQAAAQYGVVKLGTVAVIAGDKFRKVEDPNEQALVTAILQVTSDETPQICFVGGHGEHGLADTSPTGLALLAETLAASNYSAQAISLLQGEVPATCRTVVVAGAQQPFEPSELERLTGYMDKAGRVAILLEPDPAPSFAEILRPRGIDPGAGSIIDASGAGQQVGEGPRSPLAQAYGDHPITRGFNLASLFNGARPLQAIEQPEYGGRPVAIALTSQRSFASTAADAAPAFDQSRDRVGPLALAVATQVGPLAVPAEQLRLAVFGDSDFISNAYSRRQGNDDIFLRTLAWLTGEQEATIVAVDARENRRLELTETTRAWMYLVNLGLLPLIPLIAGLIVFIRSRR